MMPITSNVYGTWSPCVAVCSLSERTVPTQSDIVFLIFFFSFLLFFLSFALLFALEGMATNKKERKNGRFPSKPLMNYEPIKKCGVKSSSNGNFVLRFKEQKPFLSLYSWYIWLYSSTHKQLHLPFLLPPGHFLLSLWYVPSDGSLVKSGRVSSRGILFFCIMFSTADLTPPTKTKTERISLGQETEGASRVWRQGYTISTYTTNILKSIKQVRNQNKEKERKSEGKSSRRPNRIWWKSKRD